MVMKLNKPKKISKAKQKHKQIQKTDAKKTSYQRWSARANQMMDERLEKESHGMIILKFFTAPIIASIGLFLLYLMLDYPDFKRLGGLMLAYFFPPLGKESVIPVGISAGFHPIMIALSIAFVDIFVAMFLLWNYDLAKVVPIFGPWMEKLEKMSAKKYVEKPWLEKLAFIGLVLFVMFPFQGSGGVGTSILGRIIGMNKYKVFFAIIIGAVVGCLLIAYFSDLFISIFANDLVQGLILLIMIAIALAVYDIFKFTRKKKSKI